MIGRDLLYPRDFGTVTAGSANVNPIGVDYNALRMHVHLYGADGANKQLAYLPTQSTTLSITRQWAKRRG